MTLEEEILAEIYLAGIGRLSEEIAMLREVGWAMRDALKDPTNERKRVLALARWENTRRGVRY